ncbi:divalent-cation tolerance protein CutA [Prosthecochloris sp. ZM_2]|uniref:divalent-cation tolerance protein CutA n=1 Tax=Prosthecochloris sp. ZM_2 TaxID=2045206 RepID=UPI000DF828E0|nr:divalent-cation tolerance protein CutA [Prosthecochloris sp. ZM_2]RNA64431.1 divalent-cation tolerance protein CutA [Prosthecochloris sp. ZM_2]
MIERKDDICILQTTVPDESMAETITRAVLEDHLAACVHLSPVKSRYLWKGEISRDDELLLCMKTTMAAVDELERVIRGLHPYEVPEILVLPVAGGSEDYIAWVEGCISGRR